MSGAPTYGLVAKCRKNNTDQAVAFKVLSEEEEYSACKEMEAFLRLQRFDLDQINVSNCFDWFVYQDCYCFTFELLDQSLYDNFMTRRQWLSLRVSEIRAIKQLLIALKALKEFWNDSY